MFRKGFILCWSLAASSLAVGTPAHVAFGAECPQDPPTEGVVLTDVTAQWTYHWEVISAFPRFYDLIPKEENANVIRVFKVTKTPEATPPFERRLEVFYTGGDWMEYGYTYFVTDARNRQRGIPGEYGGAYFIADMSTTDREEGAEPPKVDPLNQATLECFIRTRFFDDTGEVRADFTPIPPRS